MKKPSSTNTRYEGYLLAALLCLFAIMLGCTRQPVYRGIPVTPVVKTYFNYQPGTYWIYRDTLTGQVDSFVVVSNGRATNNIGGYQYDETSIQIATYNGAERDNLTMYIALDSNLIRQVLYISQKQSLYVEFTYPYSNLGPVTSMGNQRTQIYLSENETVSNQSFDTVAHITNYDEPQTHKMIEDFCTSAGILKLSIDSGSTVRRFELQRYHLVR
jgi:hypothetical protein